MFQVSMTVGITFKCFNYNKNLNLFDSKSLFNALILDLLKILT